MTIEDWSDEKLVERLIDYTAKWAPGASGLCLDPMSESFRQNLVKYRDEVLRRLRLSRSFRTAVSAVAQRTESRE